MNHFLDINNFNKSSLEKILVLAKLIKKNPNKYSSSLKGKSLGLIFEKQSTRTRLSFSIGMQKLGGNVIELDEKKIGFKTRETLDDVIKAIGQYLDILMIRNNDHKKLIDLASLNILPIINGLTDFSHPCQILSDIFTIEECLGKIQNQKIAWLGDFNNVLISLIHSAEIFKFQLNVLTPNLLLKNSINKLNNKNLKFTKFFTDIGLGMENIDCVMTDTWISMGEKNKLNKKKLLKKFQVNKEVMKKANKNAIFMHCLPAHRGEEVTKDIIDGNQSIIWQQAQNRMYVQQSILNFVLQNDK